MSRIFPEPNTKVAEALARTKHPWMAFTLEVWRLTPRVLWTATLAIAAWNADKLPPFPKVPAVTIAAK